MPALRCIFWHFAAIIYTNVRRADIQAEKQLCRNFPGLHSGKRFLPCIEMNAEDFMNALNQIIIEGNVVQQPEKRQNKNGTYYCYVPIAVNRSYKGSEGKYVNEVSFFDITTFGSVAELCEKWCPKGRGIRVVGRLRQNCFKTEDGKSRSKIEIIAEHVEFKPFLKKDAEAQEDADSGKSAARKKQKTGALARSEEAVQKEQEEDDEIAF